MTGENITRAFIALPGQIASDPAVEAGQAGEDLDFERATYAQSDAGPPCANCNRPLTDEYWEFSSRPICANCKGQIAAVLEASQSKAAFVRAIVQGGGVAVACGIGYGVFVALTGYQLALITIGIAFVVAKVIRKCSAGVGGRRYQVLAVVLTYLASTMGYAPAMLEDFGVGILAAPFIAATQAPIGLLIVAFGLWEAWKLTGGVPMVLGGPYRRTAVPPA